MIRQCLAIAAATALTAAAAPALAQTVSPPKNVPVPTWTDPQVRYPAGATAVQGTYSTVPGVVPAGPTYTGAPYSYQVPPGGSVAYPVTPATGTAAVVAGTAYNYGPQYVSTPCGCGSYMVNWVQVPIQTHYTYSQPIQHVHEIPTERVVNEVVTVPVRQTKYVRSTKPAKITKTKAVRSSK